MNINLDAYNNHGQTALHIAQLHGHEEIVGVLVEAGASKLPVLPCIMDTCNNECRQAHNCKETHG
jgi:ankyrin repeat protein